MLWLYNIGVRAYYLAIYFASFFNAKARLWINGRKNQQIAIIDGCTWFHFASLGEFEQGSPVLEALRVKEPETKIVITFFSPSGYEVRKNTNLADAVYYLPLDTAANAANFINAINPVRAIFTKYEYWYHYFNRLNKQQVSLYIISGIFRPRQIFFKWYGGLHRQMLKMVTHFFLQDQKSVDLLKTLGVNNIEISGDTRFDRVWVNAVKPTPLPKIAAFKGNQNVLIAGSTWPQDEQLLAGLIDLYPGWKWIIAPHETGRQSINTLRRLLPREKTILFSQIEDFTLQHNVLIIDNIGMLSSIYQYGNIAYIGGGFGKGIHNTLEAAAFGLPVIFGPKYHAFKEANDMIELKAGFSVKDLNKLQLVTGPLITDDHYRRLTGQIAKDYVQNNTGATERILKKIISRNVTNIIN